MGTRLPQRYFSESTVEGFRFVSPYLHGQDLPSRACVAPPALIFFSCRARIGNCASQSYVMAEGRGGPGIVVEITSASLKTSQTRNKSSVRLRTKSDSEHLSQSNHTIPNPIPIQLDQTKMILPTINPPTEPGNATRPLPRTRSQSLRLPQMNTRLGSSDV